MLCPVRITLTILPVASLSRLFVPGAVPVVMTTSPSPGWLVV